MIKENRCIHIIRLRADDESHDLCDLNNRRTCVLMSGEKCEVWDAIRAEWAAEEDAEILAQAQADDYWYKKND